MNEGSRVTPGSRRLLLARIALLALAWSLPVAAVSADKTTYLKSIETKRVDDAYVLEATFLAPVQQQLCFEVLTDFDRFDRIVPNVKSSKISKREGNRMIIDQTGTAKFGVASIPYASQRQIDVDPPRSIKSVQTQGSMKRMESLMQLKPEAGGTEMKYRIELVPSAAAGLVLTPERLERDIAEQFNAMIDEMVRRNR